MVLYTRDNYDDAMARKIYWEIETAHHPPATLAMQGVNNVTATTRKVYKFAGVSWKYVGTLKALDPCSSPSRNRDGAVLQPYLTQWTTGAISRAALGDHL